MRRRLLIAAGLCAAAAAAIWAVALNVGAARTLDLRLLERVYFLGGWDAFRWANEVTDFFNPAPGLIFAAALVAGAVLAGRRRQALVAAVVIAGSELTAQGLKVLLAAQRDSPPDHYMPAASWPSGHTAGVVSLSIALVIVVP